MLREGALDDKEIEIEVAALPPQMEIMAPPGMEDLTSQIQGMFQQMGGGRRKLTQDDGRRGAEAAHRRGSRASCSTTTTSRRKALAAAEQNGIVFLDEIDKIAARSETQGADVSRQGVQRDLLPLVEGTTVTTKYGMVKTDHILFIASGAFHLSKPSDLIPELQGRFPIRVELSLAVGRRLRADPHRHRRLPHAPVRRRCSPPSRCTSTSGPTASGAWPRSRIAVNEKQENIGARRLYTVMERLLEDVSFHAARRTGETDRHRRARSSTRTLAGIAGDDNLARTSCEREAAPAMRR